MARYCFYCGRALKSGEKCGCRTSVKEKKAQEEQQEPTKKPGKPGGFKNIFPRTRPSRSKAGRPARPARNFRSFRLQEKPKLHLGRNFISYLTRPADAAQQSPTAADTYIALLLLFILGVTGGLLLISGLRQPQLMLLLSLNTATATAANMSQSYWFLFVQGFGFCLSAALLLVFLYQIILKAAFRISLGFRSILTSLNPALFFSALFLLGTLLALPASVFSALLTLAAGLAVSVILQYLTMRQISRLDGNRSFMLVAFVQILLTSILSLLFNLALPVIKALLDHSVVI